LCVLTVAKTTRVEVLPVVTPSHQPHPTHKPSPQVRPAQTRAVRASMYTDVAILARKGEKDCASPATVSLCQASSFWRFLSFQIQFEISRLKKRGVPMIFLRSLHFPDLAEARQRASRPLLARGASEFFFGEEREDGCSAPDAATDASDEVDATCVPLLCMLQPHPHPAPHF
jgi:hypothetical protein